MFSGRINIPLPPHWKVAKLIQQTKEEAHALWTHVGDFLHPIPQEREECKLCSPNASLPMGRSGRVPKIT